MTDPAPGEPAPQPPDSPVTPGPPRSRFGLFRFTIEGRRAPALFVGGWLAALVGGGLLAIGFVANGSLAAGVLLLAGLAVLTLGLVLLGGSQSVERQAAGEAYGGPSPVLLLGAIVTATLLVAAILGIVLELAGVRLDASQRPLGDLIGVAVQALVFVGMVRLMIVGGGALSWADMGFVGNGRQVAAGLALGAIYALPIIVLTSIVVYVAVQLVGQTPPAVLPPAGTALGLVLHLVAAAVIAPLSEETLFRGAALTAWLRSVGPMSAITRSAVLFAAAHVLEVGGGTFGEAVGMAAVALVIRLPVAFALGWLFARTRTIWAPLGLHMAFNGILVIVGEIGQAAV